MELLRGRFRGVGVVIVNVHVGVVVRSDVRGVC